MHGAGVMGQQDESIRHASIKTKVQIPRTHVKPQASLEMWGDRDPWGLGKLD